MSFSTIIRLIAITAGIVSMTILAWKGLGYKFDPFFLATLQVVEDYAGDLVRPFELDVIQPAVKWLRGWGLDLNLQPHWKHAFVLLWLFLGSMARGFASGNDLVGTTLLWIGGAFFALLGAVFAGSVPLSSMNFYYWAAAFFYLYWATGMVLVTYLQPEGRASSIAVLVMATGLTAWFGLAAAGSITQKELLPPAFITSSQNPALMSLVLGATFLAVILIIAGVYDRERGFALDNPLAQVGLNILAVLSGAAAIVAINQLLVGA